MNKPQVGKRYHSKAGNTIEIMQEIEVHDSEGRPCMRYTGKPVRTIKGHEELLKKIHIFDDKGRWCTSASAPVAASSIHDLKEECKDKK